jgi:hypothetical protein
VPRGGRLDPPATVLPHPLDGAVSHPTTLMKLTTHYGSAAVYGINEALLAKAAVRHGRWQGPPFSRRFRRHPHSTALRAATIKLTHYLFVWTAAEG